MDKSKVKILVVDDEQGLCAGVQEALRREGYVVDAMTDAPAALKLAEERLYNLIVSDIKMPGLSGLELLARVRAHSRDTLFILMTAYGTVESAVEAMKQGAYDYLPKPIDMKRLRALVQKALEFQAVVAENNELRLRLQTRADAGLLVGECESMRAVARLIEEVANSDVTVLIEGESGTGKEIVARSIHAQSARRDRPFISVNCAALAEQLLEAELFGHVKGAFTGRHRQQAGPLPTGRRRHAVPGRDRRPFAQRAGRPAARAGGRRVPDGRRLRADPRQCAGHCGHEQEAAATR